MFVLLFVARTLRKMANINNARYNVTPSNPVRLAQMMLLAQMARVYGNFWRLLVLTCFKQFPQDFIQTNGASHLRII